MAWMKKSDKAVILIKLLFDIKKLLAPEGYLYAGFPNYNNLFGRDAIISAWQMLPIDQKIARGTLKILAQYQAKEKSAAKDAETGKILHELRLLPEKQRELPHWEWPYYGSVDATSLFLILAKEYAAITGDKDFIYDLWPAITLAVWWHIDNASRNSHGFITYRRQNPHGLFHQGWKDSPEDHLKITPPVAIVEEQGYAYSALKAYIFLGEWLDLRGPYIKEVAELLQNLKGNFRNTFWMKEEQYFALAIDGNGRQRRAVTSNPGHLLICGDFLEEKYVRAIVRRLFQRDMWTIGGIRTHSEKEPDFDPFSYHLGSIWPHDNWLIYKGLKRWGFVKEANRIKQALFKAYHVLGGMPECYTVTAGLFGRQKITAIKKIDQLERNAKIAGKKHLASFTPNPIQAWSIGALLNMLLDDYTSEK